MTTQLSLFAPPRVETDPPREGYARYEITVGGVPMFADFNPQPFGAGIAHIEFQSKYFREPNPLSETGYRSHFAMASAEGMAEGEILAEINAVAAGILAESKHRKS